MDEAVAAIHKRFTCRMHNLKGPLQRFTQCFNRTHSHSEKHLIFDLLVRSGEGSSIIMKFTFSLHKLPQ
jgi:hypothetical protein